MKNIRLISLFTLLLVFASCSTSVEKKQERKINAYYTIIYDSMEEFPTSDHRTFTIGIDSTLTIEQLSSISDSIIQNYIGQRKPLDIKFRILDTGPGVNIYNTLYAETKIDSTRHETVIVYNEENKAPLTNIDVSPSTTKQNVPVDNSLVGTWMNEYGIYNMHIKNGTYYLVSKYIDGSGNTEKLSVKTKNGRLIFNVEGDNTEYFIIKPDGLYIYDSFGDLGVIYKNR